MAEPIQQTLSFSLLRSRRGSVSVTVEYDIPYYVDSLRADPPDLSSVVRSRGFDEHGWDEYEWDGITRRPEIEFAVPVGEYHGGGRGRTRADAGSWALFSAPRVGTGYSYGSDAPTGDDPFGPGIERSVELDGQGVMTDSLVFLGPHEEHTRYAGGEWFRLIEPWAASLTADSEAVLDALAGAAATLDVGARADDEVVAIAAPAEPIDWGLSGLATWDETFWVRADVGVRVPRQTWIHEYIHTRQSFGTTAETEWLREATATYLAAKLGHEQGLVEDATFARFVNDTRYRSEVLAREGGWSSFRVPYRKGAHVVGWLDAELHDRGDATAVDLLRALNDHDGSLEHEDFRRLCTGLLPWTADADAFGDEIDRYVLGSDAPDPFAPRGVESGHDPRSRWGDWWDGDASTLAEQWGVSVENRNTVTVQGGGGSVVVDTSSASSRVRVSIEGGDVEVHRGDGNDGGSGVTRGDGGACGFCGAEVEADVSRCPECGWTFGW